MLKERYWGRHFWARGYCCATVGQMTEKMIQEYLAHHFDTDRTDKFCTESEASYPLAPLTGDPSLLPRRGRGIVALSRP